MLGIGLSLGSGGAAPVPVLRMAPLTDMRTYQRQQETGGAAGKGAGVVPVPVVLSAPAPVHARLRDVSGAVIAGPWKVADAPGGASVVQVPVDARLGWMHLDLAPGASGPWQEGTARIAMGAVAVLAGQSQAGLMHRGSPEKTITQAGLGLLADRAALCVLHDDAEGMPVWGGLADGGPYGSTFAAAYLAGMSAELGVSCAIAGYTFGATRIAEWQPGQVHHGRLMAVLDGIGGWERLIWYQGGSDAAAGTAGDVFRAGTERLLDSIAARAVRPYAAVLAAIGTRTGHGGFADVLAVRTAMRMIAEARGHAYVEPRDLDTLDGVHQNQDGNSALAGTVLRAFRGEHRGPRVVGGSRAGRAVTLDCDAAVLAHGDARRRFAVFPAGQVTGALDVSALSVSGARIGLRLAEDPGAVALDVWAYPHPDPDALGSVDGVRDGVGRAMVPLHAPCRIAAGLAGAFLDRFEGAGALADHAADTGQGWSGGAWVLSGGLLRAGGSGTGVAVSAYAPPADCFAEVDYAVQGAADTTTAMDMLLRVRDEANFYMGGWAAGGALRIGRFVGGSFTQLGTWSGPMEHGDTFRFEAAGRVLRLFQNGVLRIEAGDASFASGRVGLRIEAGDASFASGRVGLRHGGTTPSATQGRRIAALRAG